MKNITCSKTKNISLYQNFLMNKVNNISKSLPGLQMMTYVLAQLSCELPSSCYALTWLGGDEEMKISAVNQKY